MTTWNEYSRAISGLNAKEAFAVALAYDNKAGEGLRSRFVFKKGNKAAEISDLLLNYACAVGEGNGLASVDDRKVQSVTDLLLKTKLFDANNYAKRLAARVEFQSPAVLESLPRDVSGMFDAAIDDARDGDARGFAWGCFHVMQAFTRPYESPFRGDDALELYDALGEVPAVVMDTYGDAGLDVAERMMKMYGKVGALQARFA